MPNKSQQLVEKKYNMFMNINAQRESSFDKISTITNHGVGM
jgi:hypothetical protein